MSVLMNPGGRTFIRNDDVYFPMNGASDAGRAIIAALVIDSVVGGFLFAARPLIVNPGNEIFPGYGDLLWLLLLVLVVVLPWVGVWKSVS